MANKLGTGKRNLPNVGWRLDACRRAVVDSLWLAVVFSLCSLTSQSVLQSQDLTAERVYKWDFKRSDVRVSDQWPEGWKRRHDRQHPAYIDIRVVPRNPIIASAAIEAQPTLSQLWTIWETRRLGASYNPERLPQPVVELGDALIDRCLEIKMNGAAAEALGPVVKLDERFNYSLAANVECLGLHGHDVFLELNLLDRNLKKVASLTTDSLSGDVPWRNLTAGNMNSRTVGFEFGQVHVIVRPTNIRHLSGVVRIDDIQINRIPRLELAVDAKMNIVQVGQDFTISCSVVGVNEKDKRPSVRIQILNEFDRVIREESIVLERVENSKDVEDSQSPAATGSSRYVSIDSGRQPSPQHVFDGVATWKLQLDEPGYCRARVYLGEGNDYRSDRELPLAVIDGLLNEAVSPFGWSMPVGLTSEQIRALPQIVRTYGAGRIKIPIWLDANKEADKIDQLAWLVERLQAQKLMCVGVIDQPPPTQRNQFDDSNELLPITTIFQNVKTWEPLIEPILTRMSMKLNWFQLGNDEAQNYTANPQLNKAIANIKTKMQPYSQELQIAIAWSWLNSLPQNEKLAWDAMQMSMQPQLTADELEAYVASPMHRGCVHWVGINLLPADKYCLLDRVRDLAERVTVVKRNDVSAAFVTRPLDPNVGLFNADFEPQAISVPWRTLNRYVGPSRYVGTMELPLGSTNFIFENNGEGILLVWNDVQTTEQLYLGENITIYDMWGRRIAVESSRNARGHIEQRFPVGPWPILIQGIDLQIAKFRMQFHLKSTNLLSIIGRSQVLPFELSNAFDQAVRGKMDLVAPTLLQSDNATMPIVLSEGQSMDFELPLQVRSDASAGKHNVRFEFEVNAGKAYYFSSYRTLTLGFGDIEMYWQAGKVSDTELVLRLEVVNTGASETTFNCKFFPPPFPYQHFQIDKIPVGTSSREFRMSLPQIDDDAEYWIRCEEVNTRRTLNYRVRVEKPE
jgi:hypothetical protein